MKFYQIRLYCHDDDPVYGQPETMNPQVIIGAATVEEAQELAKEQYSEYPEIFIRSVKEIYPTSVIVSWAECPLN